MKKQRILSEYNYPVINNINVMETNALLIVASIDEAFKDKSIFIAGIGTSGAMVMTMIISKSNGRFFPLLYRKENENCHRSVCETVHSVDIEDSNSVIIIVDDMVASGKTIFNIKERMDDVHAGRSLKVVGIACNNAHQHEFSKYFPNLELVIS